MSRYASNQEQSAEDTMASEIQADTAEVQLQTIAFTEAQARRVAELQAALNAAQGELQKFVSYLGDEYKPDPQKPWALTATGFVEQPPAGA